MVFLFLFSYCRKNLRPSTTTVPLKMYTGLHMAVGRRRKNLRPRTTTVPLKMYTGLHMAVGRRRKNLRPSTTSIWLKTAVKTHDDFENLMTSEMAKERLEDYPCWVKMAESRLNEPISPHVRGLLRRSSLK
nr:uncharacterized protein C22orf42 homolog isoform X3 [Symphalangus syndactylus]XP_055109500.1 uncharacterized protein C22orf42 homolog isoform X3 [Symphalangus syndactylus]XP_055109501.1 uncharacterized protein C22orf42 homolog isoform X3 [Symphalangus syndactylus]